MAIKDSAETWVRGKPFPAMILVVAVGIVVGGLVGLGAGYKIEQNRTHADVVRLQNQLKKSNVVPLAAPVGQRVGKVTATKGDTITITTKLQGAQQVKTTGATQFETTVAGKVTDITVGTRLLLTINGHDVIILPTSSKLGRKVTKLAATFFQIAKPNGTPGGKIPLANVQDVKTLTSGQLSDIKTGSSVIAGGKAGSTKQDFNAVEVILLPTGSGFAT